MVHRIQKGLFTCRALLNTLTTGATKAQAYAAIASIALELDPEKGKALMQTSTEKYEAFVPASSIPHYWGKAANAYIWEMAKNQ